MIQSTKLNNGNTQDSDLLEYSKELCLATFEKQNITDLPNLRVEKVEFANVLIDSYVPNLKKSSESR